MQYKILMQKHQTKVTASASPAPNEVESDISTYGSAYGLIGGFTTFSHLSMVQ